MMELNEIKNLKLKDLIYCNNGGEEEDELE